MVTLNFKSDLLLVLCNYLEFQTNNSISTSGYIYGSFPDFSIILDSQKDEKQKIILTNFLIRKGEVFSEVL